VAGQIDLGSTIDGDFFRRRIEKHQCEKSLAYFVRAAWQTVEPGAEYFHNWHVDMICAHLEAITDELELDDGDIYNRLLINVPPGMMKSLLMVFWNAWEWGPRNMAHLRYVCVSHDMGNTIRDNMRVRQIIESDWYREFWGDRVQMKADQNAKTNFENTKGGFRIGASPGGVTGKRGDRVILDDPNSWESANSEAMRDTTNNWFRGALQLRLNRPKYSAIVCIMQRLHEDDVSGVILDGGLGYDAIILPMRYDPDRSAPTKLGFVDPREEPGELLFEARFPRKFVDRVEKTMGPYEVSGQHQQSPTPKGGGIIKDDWWLLLPAGSKYPPFDFVLASLDTAYTEKQENDYSAMTIWGVFSPTTSRTGATSIVNRHGGRGAVERFEIEGAPNIMLVYAWQERASFPDLVKKVAELCSEFKVDKLIIENKAAGISLEQEMRRTFATERFAVQLIDPKSLDKTARLYSVQSIFSEGMVWAPGKTWAEMVIRQVSSFPKGKHDDLVDTVSQALRHLRDIGILTRAPERLHDIEESMRYTGPTRPAPLYPA
jgi:predicted phage terminase large subunit-like protein